MTKLALVLVGSLTSPYVRKVRLAAATLRLPLTVQREAQWSPESRLGAFNPLAKVPVLLTPDAGPLYDSRVIIAYLENLSGVSLRPPEALDAIRDQRIEALADGISEALALTVLETWRAADRRSAIWTQRQLAKIDRGIEALAQDLAAGHLPGEQVTSGGLATLCALEALSFWQPDHDWRAAQPGLATWTEIWRDLPHYDETRPVRPAGVVFPAL